MNIQEQINVDLKQAMLDRNEELKSFLRVIIGEYNRGVVVNDKFVKDFTDDMSIKLFKSLKESATIMGNQFEIDVLDRYLPKMKSEDEIKTIVDNIIAENNITLKKEMGKIMSTLKSRTDGAQIDNKIASKYINEILS